MKKTVSTLFLILTALFTLSAQNNEKMIWRISEVAETRGGNSNEISWTSTPLHTKAVLTNNVFEIEDFNKFYISDLKKEVQGFARRDIYSFKDEYDQTGKIIFHTDPTNTSYDSRYLIFVLFDNSTGRVFFTDKPEIIQSNKNRTSEVNEEYQEESVPFVMVEEKPQFMGGDCNEFSKWVNMHLEYPENAKKNGVQGRVTTEFTVDKDGNVINVKILRGVDPALNEEAIRVISMSPKWEPGKLRGKAVPVVYTFPVIFHLR